MHYNCRKPSQSAWEMNTTASSKGYDITVNQAYGSASAKLHEESDNHRLSDVYTEILPQKCRFPIREKLSESPSPNPTLNETNMYIHT